MMKSFLFSFVFCMLLSAFAYAAEETLEVTAPAETSAPAAATEPAVVEKNVAEVDIPVQLESPKKTAASENPLMKALLSAILVASVGFGAFFFLKKYAANKKGTQATDIKVLSQHYLGPKKSLAIIRVAGESILIGVTEQNISLIKPLSLMDDEIPGETPKKFNIAFNERNQEDNQNGAHHGAQDEFSIGGIKDFVNQRLKNMRNLE